MANVSDSGNAPAPGWVEFLVRRIARFLGWVFGRIWNAVRFIGRAIRRVFGRIWQSARPKGRADKKSFSWILFVPRTLSKVTTMWRKPKRNSDEEKELKRMVEREEMVGTYFSTFETNIILRFFLSPVVATVPVAFLFAVDTILGTNMLPWWAALILLLLLTALFATNDKEKGGKKIVIPEAHVGILTFLGTRLNAYLEEGDHDWWGGKFGFGVSNAPLPNRKEYKHETEKGYVFIGDRTISIWPNRKEPGKVKLETISGIGSTNTSTLTDTFKTYWPLAWANADDPILDIAERSRSGLRTIASFLPGFDNVKMQTIFSGLMAGGTLVTALTKEAVDIFDRGSVIQDESGRHIFEMVKYDPDQTREERRSLIDAAETRVSAKIIAEGDEKMKTMVLDAEGNPRIQIFSLNKEDDIHAEETDKHLVPVLTDCGCHLERATIGEILTSKEEQEQANKAAGEGFQRRGQRMNAAAMRENTETMRENLAKEGGEAALAAALAADGKADFTHVSGGDRISRAFVAGAKAQGGKK